jgi:hypothetical protein
MSFRGPKADGGLAQTLLLNVCEVRGSEPQLYVSHRSEEFRYAKSQTPEHEVCASPRQAT